MAAGSSSGALLTLRVLLFCALAAAATTLLPLATSPCTHSLSRSILAATGLDPYLFSCAGGDASEAPLLSQGDDGANKTGGSGARRPIVTDQLCVKGKLPPHALPPFQCCPPVSASEPINFTLPDPSEPLRTRRPVHVVGAEYMAKYTRAVALMKALPRSDPRSFYQQANVHCAYCTGAHRQVGRPDLGVQIHFSWLFFPFHRAYLYFFERIAAKLLGEPGFALPVWSWDVPEGMGIPEVFTDEASPLYDPIRELSHAPPKVADLDFFLGGEKNLTDEQQVLHNLRVMYKQMISGAALPSLFLGQPYRTGDAPMPGPGTVEWAPHNTMHTWTGDNSLPNVENMGVYYSAGRDPLFYPHHANIDRLWEAWRGIAGADGRRHEDFTDPDWLDSSFLLYDEEARLVRITVRDVLNTERLRYRYGGVGLPWLSARPPVTPGVNPKGGRLESVRFPVSLDTAVTAEVRRPPRAQRRSLQEKQAQEEVLVVEGIEADAGDFVRFDVYVNAREYYKVPLGGREMAGSFTTLKHPGKEGTVVRTSMTVALNELLEDLGAEGDDSVTVSLVPVRGKVRIGGLRIVYMEE
ncbi:Polyphenol oxidase, chloroplastic [Dichanthelium oligosanthes]|uniref:Polyphenol oxidase, chloroplastic n=1 Tax=Dichanthelium oligosanthes TaxID=888268 RepID=A0A1E5WNI9_9POAL|nr:Polyphenol oxidase, chloroplastic [Dichanthelium oligosanthes]